MRYPIAIEPGDNQHAFGVVVPDLPGCLSAGDPLEKPWPRHAKPSSRTSKACSTKASSAATQLGRHACGQSEFQGWIWAIVEIDPEDLSDAVERVNITLPRRVLTAADRYAAAHRESCSGLLARAALETMARD